MFGLMKRLMINLLLLLIILASCTPTKDVQVKIISNKVVSKKDFVKAKNLLQSGSDINLTKSVLKFKIINPTNKNYVLRTKNLFDTYAGFNSEKGKNLDLDFLQIIDLSNHDTVAVNHHFTLPMIPENKFKKQERKTKKQFNNLNYNKSTDWYNKNKLISSNLIFLKSNETKFYEVFVNLPYSDASNSGASVNLDTNKEYKTFIKVVSDTTNIKKHLTWSQLQYIKENNYKLYHGTLISKNSVPVKFVE